jgi:adenosylhomocysteine nucleosidase
VKILLTFAVDAEFGPWRERHKFETVKAGDLTLQRTMIGDAEITVLITGVGPEVARANVGKVFTEHAFERRLLDLCISAGLAGALRRAHLVGDVVIPKMVCSDRHESAGEFPVRFKSDTELVEIARECGGKIVERCLTTGRIVRSAAEKSSLGAEAEIVEMESYEVLSEASAWGARGIAIRAVSDAANETLPIDFSQTITETGGVSYWRVLREVAKHPGSMPGLIRFGRNTRDAANKLAEYLDHFFAALAERARVPGSNGMEYGSAVSAR